MLNVQSILGDFLNIIREKLDVFFLYFLLSIQLEKEIVITNTIIKYRVKRLYIIWSFNPVLFRKRSYFTHRCGAVGNVKMANKC